LACQSNAEDAAGLLCTALRSEDAVAFFEHHALLYSSQARRPWPGDAYSPPLGQAGVLSEGEALTVVKWGALVYSGQEAVEGLQDIEVRDLRTNSPWDKGIVLESVKKTGRCLVVNEYTLTVVFAGGIIATIAGEAFEWLDAPARRLATADCPILYSTGLMQVAVPGADLIRKHVLNLLN
jgi:2-oxoisovalerate dehydrogenase E1 component